MCLLNNSDSFMSPQDRFPGFLRGALGAYQLLQLRFFSGTQHELSTLLGHSSIQARSIGL